MSEVHIRSGIMSSNKMKLILLIENNGTQSMTSSATDRKLHTDPYQEVFMDIRFEEEESGVT